MKILYITTLAKDYFGTFVRSSIYAAAECGAEYCVAANETGVDKNIKDEECKKLGIKHCNIPISRSPLKIAKNYKAYKILIKYITENNIDIIHCNTPIGGLLGRIVGKKCKVKKIIYQAHGFHFYNGAPLKNWLFYYPVEKILSYITDILITINKEDFAFAKKKMSAKKTLYVHGVGLDTEALNRVMESKESIREKAGLPIDKYLIFSTGELNENKNHETVIRGIHACGYENIHYMIAGKGPLERQLKELAKELDMSDRIHFLGFCNNIPELLHAVDLFCFPSYREGLSAALMEAMASGVPVIASDIRGNRDLIDDGKGGFLVKPNDVEGFAEKIAELYRDSDKCKKFAEYSSDKVKNFDISVAVEELKKIYNSLI